MQNTACISGADYREFLDLVVKSGKRRRRTGIANVVIIVTEIGIAFSLFAFLWALWAAFSHERLHELLLRPASLIPILIALFIVPVAAIRIWGISRRVFKKKANAKDAMDETALRVGLNTGEMLFDFDDDGIRVSSALVDESYSWDAFQGLEESERNFFLMLDGESAVIMPKEVNVGGRSLEASRAFLAARIWGHG